MSKLSGVFKEPQKEEVLTSVSGAAAVTGPKLDKSI
jgi:hypothetical protein